MKVGDLQNVFRAGMSIGFHSEVGEAIIISGSSNDTTTNLPPRLVRNSLAPELPREYTQPTVQEILGGSSSIGNRGLISDGSGMGAVECFN
jgi:hypothetical protein